MKAIAKSKPEVPKGISKEWTKTSPTYFKITPKSSTGRGDLASNGTRSEMSPKKGMGVIDKSMPAVPRNAKKWIGNSKYTWSGPITQNFGKA